MAAPTMTSGTAGIAGLYANAYLEKTFVSTLKKKLLAARFGVDSSLPEGAGAKVVRWQYFTAPAAITTSIGANEGSDGTAVAQTTTTAQATLGEYSGYTDFSKYMQRTALSGTMEKFAEMLGYQAALSIDSLVHTALAGPSGTTTTANAGAALTAENVRSMVSTLEVNNAQPHRATGGENFIGLIHSDSLYDMLGEGAPTWWQAKNQYVAGAFTNPFKDTMPSAGLYNALLYKTNNVATTATQYLNIILADDSFGVAALDTNVMNPRLIRTMPEELVSAPARNRGTIAWWALFASVLFDSARVGVIQTGT